MSDNFDETATWTRARDGDAAAFAALFRQHQARIYRRALALVPTAHDAEDVTAATFFELWRKRREVRMVDGTVVPWLLVTTVNFARNRRRGSGRYKAVIASLSRHPMERDRSIRHNVDHRLGRQRERSDLRRPQRQPPRSSGRTSDQREAGSGSTFDDALARPVNGLHKTELIRQRDPWQHRKLVKEADRRTNLRTLSPPAWVRERARSRHRPRRRARRTRPHRPLCGRGAATTTGPPSERSRPATTRARVGRRHR